MNPQDKKPLITTAGSILGTVGGSLLGNPMLGYKIGTAAGTLAGGLVRDTPIRRDRLLHFNVGPDGHYSAGINQRPLLHTTYEQQTPGPLGNILNTLNSIAGPITGSALGSPGMAGVAQKAVPTAREGTFIPPNAPTHEQGGVDVVKKGTGEFLVEAEADEYIIPGQKVNRILESSTYDEIGRRFVNEVGLLKQKGMDDFSARGGMNLNLVDPATSFRQGTYLDFNSPREIQSPSQIPQFYHPADNISPVLRHLEQQNQVVPSTGEYGNERVNLNFRPLDIVSPIIAGLEDSRAELAPTKNEMDETFQGLIGLQEKANRDGNLIRAAQGLINLRGLMEPMRPSPPLTTAPLQRVSFVDPSAGRINQAKRELGMGMDILSQLSAPERIAGVSGLLGNYGQAMGQISEARSDMMNQQAQINAQIDAQEKQNQFETELRNRELRAREAALKHQRNQIGISGISDAASGIIQSTAQKNVNVKELSLMQNLIRAAQTQEQLNALIGRYFPE